MGEHPDEIALRRDFDGVELALDRLHRHRLHRSEKAVHQRGANDRRLRHAVDHDRHQAWTARRVLVEAGRESVAIFAEIVDPDAIVPRQETAGGLVGEIDPAREIDGEERGGCIVEDGFEKAIIVAQAVPLLAQPLDSLVERVAEFTEAAAFVQAREILRKIAEAHRLDEAGKLDIGALDVAPEPCRRPDEEEAGEHARGAEPLDRQGVGKGESRQQQQRDAPQQADDEAAFKAHAFPCADRARRG